jgi:hypothetical protein
MELRVSGTAGQRYHAMEMWMMSDLRTKETKAIKTITHTRGFSLGIFAFSLGTSSRNAESAVDADATTAAGHAISASSSSSGSSACAMANIGEL